MHTGEELKERLEKMLYGPDDDPNIKPQFGDSIPYGSESWKDYQEYLKELGNLKYFR